MNTDIKSMNLRELTDWLGAGEAPSFRAKQIYQWMHQKLASGFEEMTDLPQEMRKRLAADARLVCLEPVKTQVSALDETTKYLFRLDDDNFIESVWMKYKHGRSVCISSQVGCRMGCRFCASTLDGMVRNLSPSEMLDQIYRIQKLTGERVDNVVVMGSGEPFDNYDAFLKFAKLLMAKEGLCISARNLTVSTCGLVPQIHALADEELQLTLAVSLHAPEDELRKTLMPVANRYSLKEIMEACRYYFQKTGRRVTFEYSLMQGVNDSPDQAVKLAALLKDFCCHVNLIPVNPVKERGYRQSMRKEVQSFKNKLEKYGINVTIRREMGRDIDGACGQLRKRYSDGFHAREDET